MTVIQDSFDTPIGAMRAIETDGRLTTLRIGSRTIEARDSNEAGELTTLRLQMAEYLSGRRREFRVETSLAQISDFDRKVLARLCDVGYGETVTYGELAEMCGKPRAARAVGGALNRNPLPILIPCHRVVAADGTLGGYGGGLEMKRTLLEIEGVTLPPGGWPPSGRRRPATTA